MSTLYKYIEENDNEQFEFNLFKHFSGKYIYIIKLLCTVRCLILIRISVDFL